MYAVLSIYILGNTNKVFGNVNSVRKDLNSVFEKLHPGINAWETQSSL